MELINNLPPFPNTATDQGGHQAEEGVTWALQDIFLSSVKLTRQRRGGVRRSVVEKYQTTVKKHPECFHGEEAS